ncbi:TIGR04028 family ABC transporter substrate-binding protein [Gluconacetobacter diazotrophicus]|uniref:TIGR04028 family ABC transporter substrate-binding protein n=1 Tax=Gluconacetobacter diazotrophicus TaxID=33996 RepID=A0A7W4I624_GLUDI|nr:TIGR04028 family ABC transporter substrate-binding protein [Gluconacetobacter diazotrophicus]
MCGRADRRTPVPAPFPPRRLTLKPDCLPVLFAVAAFAAAALPSAHAQGPQQGGELIYLDPQAHTNLYPPAAGFYPNGGILDQVTDRLTWQNPQTLEIEPWLAQSWSSNADDTEYTFHLRPGVTFSDGTPLDARAVALNYETYGKGNPALHFPVSEVINNFDHAEILDPLTVRFHFTRPSPGFLQGTSVIGSGIVSPATLAHPFDQLGVGTQVIGSGPFVIVRDVPGKEVDLVARRDYAWPPASRAGQTRAWLDGVKILVTPEDSIRVGALLAGQADLIRQVEAYDEEQVTLAGYRLYAPSTRGVNTGIAFRPDNPLVADIRVREALLHATDRQEIVTTLYSANYPLARSVLSARAAGFRDLSDRLGFDPRRAAQLLDEAGWRLGPDGLRHRDGQTLALGIHISQPHPQNRTMLELLAQQWRRVGVQLTVMSGSAAGVILDNLDPTRTPVTVSEVGRADPDVMKSEFFPSNRDTLLQKGGQSAKVRAFRDDRLDAMLLQVASDTDRQDRLRHLGDVQEYIVQNAYTIPIFEEPQVYAGAPGVHGVGFEAVGRPSFYGIWLDRR